MKKCVLKREKNINTKGKLDYKLLPNQVFTKQLLSNVRLRTPVLQYLFVNLLWYENICTCQWSRKYLTHFFISIVPIWVSLGMLMVFLSPLQYACNMRIYIKIGINIRWHPNVLCTFTLRHLPKKYKPFAILLVDIYLFLIVCFLSYRFWKFWCFLHVLIFAIRAF